MTGSYLKLPSVRAGSVVGQTRCTSCDRPCNVKVNKVGNLYWFCVGDDSCGTSAKAGGDVGSNGIVRRMIKFRGGLKKRMLAIASGDDEPEAPANDNSQDYPANDNAPNEVGPDDVAVPDIVQVKPQTATGARSGYQFKFFGKKL